ncbi:MAG TPA: cytochrome c oxidase subunit II [Gemmatimonadaceae bacterium]|nr:cytochrome c oxidase subunit II [Gemmatimonadaceae bacterium]
MNLRSRARRLAFAALTVVLAAGVAACAHDPNTIFGAHSDLGHATDALTMRLVYFAIGVFIVVEGLLVYAIVRFRRRPNSPVPKQIHGNTAIEITWTLVPAIILALIAVPTIKTIFRTQAPAPAGSLQVEVIGHQWWWEFRYPQYGVVTANELYLPVGRTVSFTLKSNDVIHSFWIPSLAGAKRDVVPNQTNYIWFTPDSVAAWDGFCAEYCGDSHANMHFRVFTEPAPQFAAWIAHQKTGPAFPDTTAAPTKSAATQTSAGTVMLASQVTMAPAADSAAPGNGIFDRDKIPQYEIPNTPTPAGLTFSNVTGDAARGAKLFKVSLCIGCHTIQGVSPGITGPNLTHVGSRYTIAGAMYPNDTKHLELWIKDAHLMKPGTIMPVFGKGLPGAAGGFTDQQIADIAAYLSSLK